MLEKTPAVVGKLLDHVRPGMEKLVWAHEGLEAQDTVVVESEAFADQTPIPARYTADGEGLFPPIAWRDLPPGTAEVILIVEDADSPTPAPLLHLLAWGLPVGPVRLAEGALPGPAGDGQFQTVARNSFFRHGWLPPDPPPGHGPHRYVFQVFAVGQPLGLDREGDKDRAIRQLRRHLLARGRLIGVYERKG